ncbi:MAG: hypothetical protein KatS3mg022_0610 [Armatimonadota bacterium]|nr:MAG: hypothetical protein KatS3mg022_0610 [Armatimonadota bacterium]
MRSRCSLLEGEAPAEPLWGMLFGSPGRIAPAIFQSRGNSMIALPFDRSIVVRQASKLLGNTQRLEVAGNHCTAPSVVNNLRQRVSFSVASDFQSLGQSQNVKKQP